MCDKEAGRESTEKHAQLPKSNEGEITLRKQTGR